MENDQNEEKKVIGRTASSIFGSLQNNNNNNNNNNFLINKLTNPFIISDHTYETDSDDTLESDHLSSEFQDDEEFQPGIYGSTTLQKRNSKRQNKKGLKKEGGASSSHSKSQKKKKIFQNQQIQQQIPDPNKIQKSKKFKKTNAIYFEKWNQSDEDFSDEDFGRLIIYDPLSYYHSDQYDSEDCLIKKIKYEQTSDYQISKKGQKKKDERKPNIPHLIKKYHALPSDKNGNPIMPIELRGKGEFSLIIDNLGTIVTNRPKFHSKRYIWPVGFKSRKVYHSTKYLDKKCTYINEILDGGKEPVFRVSSEDGFFVEKPTSSGAWAEVAKRYFEIKKGKSGKTTYTQISGPEMYGYGDPTIAKIIQEMPGADKCTDYEFQVFIPATSKNVNNNSNNNTKRISPNEKISKKKNTIKRENSDEDFEYDEFESDEIEEQYPPPICNVNPQQTINSQQNLNLQQQNTNLKPISNLQQQNLNLQQTINSQQNLNSQQQNINSQQNLNLQQQNTNLKSIPNLQQQSSQKTNINSMLNNTNSPKREILHLPSFSALQDLPNSYQQNNFSFQNKNIPSFSKIPQNQHLPILPKPNNISQNLLPPIHELVSKSNSSDDEEVMESSFTK